MITFRPLVSTLQGTKLFVDEQPYSDVCGIEIGSGWITLTLYVREAGDFEASIKELLQAKRLDVYLENGPAFTRFPKKLPIITYESSYAPIKRETEEEQRPSNKGLWYARIRFEE